MKNPLKIHNRILLIFQFLKHWAPLCWKSPHYLFVIRFNRYFSIQLEKKCDLWSEWREECYNWSFFSWLYILVLHILLHSDRPEKAVRNIKASSCIMVLTAHELIKMKRNAKHHSLLEVLSLWNAYKLPSMVVLVTIIGRYLKYNIMDEVIFKGFWSSEWLLSLFNQASNKLT